MCYNRMHASISATADPSAALPVSLAMATTQKREPYWHCSSALAQHCGTFAKGEEHDYNASRCVSCASRHAKELAAAGCTPALIDAGCAVPHGCTDSVHSSCSALTKDKCGNNHTQCEACESCAFGSPETSKHNCSFNIVYDTCGDYSKTHHSYHRSIYDQWMDGLACLADGNWFSTQAVSQCADDDSTGGADCWWRLQKNSPPAGERVINASCADGRVTSALRKRNPSCWSVRQVGPFRPTATGP